MRLKSYDKITRNSQCQFRAFCDRVKADNEIQSKRLSAALNSKNSSNNRVSYLQTSLNRNDSKGCIKIPTEVNLMRRATVSRNTLMRKNFSIESSFKCMKKAETLEESKDDLVLVI